MSLQTLHRLTIHTGLTAPPSRIVLNNQEYLTAPAVLVVAGVLNGGFLPGEELHAEDWNGVAVTVGHPLDAAGTPLSARQPQVPSIGRVYHARLSTGQRGSQRVPSLQAELWINLGEAQACGDEAMQAVQTLEAQQPLEISTAFYCDSERALGSAYGVPYTEIHRDLRPDHLALLPNSTGACSWQDGCGSPRLNAQGTSHAACGCATSAERSAMPTPSPTTWQAFVSAMRQLFVPTQEAPSSEPDPERAPALEAALAVNQTDQDVREALYGALAREMGQDFTPIYIDAIDTVNQSFTYRQGERLRMRSWQMEGDVLTLSDDAQDVQRSTTYIPVESAPVTEQHQEETAPMTTPQTSPIAIKARVNALIANARSGWKETDRATLERMDEAMLIRLEAQPAHVPALVAELPLPPATLAEAIATLPAHLREPMQVMAQEHQKRKTAAMAALIANKTCPFSQEKLQTLEVTELEALVAMAAGVDYTGKGLPPERQAPEVRDQPPAPPDTLGGVLRRQKELGMRA